MRLLVRGVLAILCVVATAQEQWDTATARKGFTPDKDPFYKPAHGWADKKPGDILRWRKIEPKFLYSDFKVKEAYQLLYRTTLNKKSEAAHTVTTVLVPHGAKNDTLVAAVEAIDSNPAKCSPSYGYLGGALDQASEAFTLDEVLFMPYLEMGHIVTVPDHEGSTLGAFAAGRLEGHMTLDGIRATLNFGRLALSKKTKVAGYGYSGGALALGWTAALHGSYAPDINAVGWAFGGTPTDVNATIDYASGRLLSGFVVSGINGVVRAYPHVRDYAMGQLTEAGQRALDFADTHCWQDLLVEYPFTDLRTTKFTKRGKRVFDTREIEALFDELKMYRKKEDTPQAPVLMYHGKNDEVIPYDAARHTAEKWCERGGKVHFITYDSPVLEHAVTEVTASARAVAFVRDQLDGKDTVGECRFETTNTALFEPGVLGASLKSAMQTILDVFGDKVGPADRKLKERIKANHGRE